MTPVQLFEYPLCAGGTLYVRPERIMCLRELSATTCAIQLTTGIEYEIAQNASELSDELDRDTVDGFSEHITEIARSLRYVLSQLEDSQ